MKKFFSIDFWQGGDDREITQRLFVAAFLTSLPMLVFYFEIGSDSSAYYIPMAREFARGNFARAFYPMIPPLFPVLTGILCFLTGLKAFFAAKFISILFKALTIFPLYAFVRDGWRSRRLALFSCLLLIVCPKVLRHAGYGEIDTGKMFFLVCSAWLLLRFFRKPSFRLAVLFGLNGAAMILIRAESLAVMVLLSGVLLTFEVLNGPRHGQRFQFPWKAAVSLVIMGMLISPWVAFEYRMTGYYVTDSRQVDLLNRVVGRDEAASWGKTGDLPDEPPALLHLMEIWSSRATDEAVNDSTGSTLGSVASEIMGGLFEFFVPFLVVGLWVTMRRGRWQRGDWLAVLIWGANTFVFLVAGGFKHTLSRYIMQALPLTLPWVAIGLGEACGRLSPKLVKQSMAVLVVVLLLAGNDRVFGDIYAWMSDSEGKAMVEVGGWLRTEGAMMVPDTIVANASTRWHYHPGRLPIVIFGHRRTGGLAETGVLFIKNFARNRFITVEELKEVCAMKNVSFVAADQYLLKYCPDLRQGDRFGELVLMKSFGDNQPVRIFGYLPNLNSRALDGLLAKQVIPLRKSG